MFFLISFCLEHRANSAIASFIMSWTESRVITLSELIWFDGVLRKQEMLWGLKMLNCTLLECDIKFHWNLVPSSGGNTHSKNLWFEFVTVVVREGVHTSSTRTMMKNTCDEIVFNQLSTSIYSTVIEVIEMFWGFFPPLCSGLLYDFVNIEFYIVSHVCYIGVNINIVSKYSKTWKWTKWTLMRPLTAGLCKDFTSNVYFWFAGLKI